MANIYVALNGDDVGEKIGSHIASDDHEGLAAASSAIDGAHQNIDQWVESVGGKKITGSGDEGIYIVPEESLGDLDSLRGSYKEQSGHDLTVGTGSSMSEASKALIYGKLNGKNQVVHYEPMIEDYLSQEDGDESDQEPQSEMPEQDELQGQADSDIESDEGVSPEEPSELPPRSASSAKMITPPPSQTEDEVDEASEEAPESEEVGVDEDPESEDQSTVGNSEIDGKAGSDFGTSDGEISEDLEESDEEPLAEGEDLPDSEETDPSDDVDSSEAPPADSSVEGESAYQDLGEEDIADPDEEEQDPSMEEQEESDDQEDPLASMIHGDMQAGDESQEQGQEEESESEDSSLDDELRSDIASALMAFKENKDMLEQAREQNPKLYHATLTMLTSMIAMAKKLGYGPEQDMQDSENNQQLQEEFPAAEEGGQEDPEAEDAQQPMDSQGAPPPVKK